MSSTLTIYVGPYLEIRGAFDWWEFAKIVEDGRWEASTPSDPLILIPSCDVPGISRQLTWDRCSDLPVVSFKSLAMIDEKKAFESHVQPVLRKCASIGIPWFIKWGVVPCVK